MGENCLATFKAVFEWYNAAGVKYSEDPENQAILVFEGMAFQKNRIWKIWMSTQRRQQFLNLSKTSLFTFSGFIIWGKIVVQTIKGFDSAFAVLYKVRKMGIMMKYGNDAFLRLWVTWSGAHGCAQNTRDCQHVWNCRKTSFLSFLGIGSWGKIV